MTPLGLTPKYQPYKSTPFYCPPILIRFIDLRALIVVSSSIDLSCTPSHSGTIPHQVATPPRVQLARPHPPHPLVAVVLTVKKA